MSTAVADVLLARHRVGVCVATSGPGAFYLLNGLYDATLEHTPVVAILEQTNRSAMGGHSQSKLAEVLPGHPR